MMPSLTGNVSLKSSSSGTNAIISEILHIVRIITTTIYLVTNITKNLNTVHITYCSIKSGRTNVIAWVGNKRINSPRLTTRLYFSSISLTHNAATFGFWIRDMDVRRTNSRSTLTLNVDRRFHLVEVGLEIWIRADIRRHTGSGR